jgi:Cd2+/Zn2+-exporting ATPase
MIELSSEDKQQTARRLGIDLLGAGILCVGLGWNWFFPTQAAIGSLLQALGAVLVAGNTILLGLRSLIKPQATNYSDQLVAIAVVAAFSIGDFVTATLVPLALDLGRLFEERTAFGIQRTIENIRSLQADTATKLVDGKESEVSISSLQKGDVVLIRAGEKIPTDGIIILGRSQVDQSAMTGESKPEKVEVGGSVFAGSVNLQGVLQIEVSKLGEDAALGRIIQLLEEAERVKIPILDRIENWLAHYMPLALAISATVLFFTEDINRAIAVLVVSFPASLAIAGPATMVSAFSKASSFSLFIKKGSFFQVLEQVDTVIFDKTGTLTHGKQELSKIHSFTTLNGTLNESEIIALAGQVAQASKHPISQSIFRHAEAANIAIEPLVEAMESAGRGVLAKIKSDGRTQTLYLGRLSWLKEQGVDIPENLDIKATAWLARDTQLLAGFSFQDQERETAKDLISFLRAQGKEIWMLTGDQEIEAQRISAELGIEQYKAEALPEEKWEMVKEQQAAGKQVLMIGDGINDALALQEADIGIAFGASLSQAVAGGADAALLSQDLGFAKYSRYPILCGERLL